MPKKRLADEVKWISVKAPSQGDLKDFPNVAFGRWGSQQSFAQLFAILIRPVDYEEPL